MAKQQPLAEIQKVALPRLEDAIGDRSTIEPYIDSVFEYGLPGRRRMNEKRIQSAQDNYDQQYIFDPELQFAMRECASELKSIYTPAFRHWADLKASTSLPPEISGNEEFVEALRISQDHLFEQMRGTRLDAALDLAWEDWQIAAGCLDINPAPGGRATIVDWVPLPELFMEACPELPTGLDGRWRMRDVKRRYLKLIHPKVDWEEALKQMKRSSSTNDGRELFEVTYGYRYDGNAWPNEAWFFEVFLEKTLVYHRRVTGSGSVGLIPFRAGENSPSAWGRGPASIALSPARALDEIAYLNLKVLPKRVDPPFWHTADGVFNPDNAIRAGDAIPAGPEFQMGFIESKHQMDDLYTEVEMLRMMVKRALWQDRPDPYEAGTTPPTAYQIQNQELGRAIRQERPRSRINPELIMPVLERFIRIESTAKRMAPIRIKGVQSPITVEPKSPLSRAADLEDVQQAQMLLQMVAAYMGDKGMMSVDTRQTILNVQDKLGEGAELVAVQSAAAGAAEMALQSGAQSAGALGGEQLAAAA